MPDLSNWHIYRFPLGCASSVEGNWAVGTPWGWLIISPALPMRDRGNRPARPLRIYWSQDGTPIRATWLWPRGGVFYA